MAKFNIEVNLDWMDEDGDIDSAIKAAIVEAITSKVSASAVADVQKKADTMIDEKVEKAIGGRLTELLEDFFARPRTITDRWGDKVKENVSVLDLLKAQCDEFIDGYVDKDGKGIKGSHYGDKKRRIDYIIEKNIDFKMRASIKTAAEQIKVGMQKYIDDTLKSQIGESVAKVIGLDKITARL